MENKQYIIDLIQKAKGHVDRIEFLLNDVSYRIHKSRTVAPMVEQRIENPCRVSSILTCPTKFQLASESWKYV